MKKQLILALLFSSASTSFAATISIIQPEGNLMLALASSANPPLVKPGKAIKLVEDYISELLGKKSPSIAREKDFLLKSQMTQIAQLIASGRVVSAGIVVDSIYVDKASNPGSAFFPLKEFTNRTLMTLPEDRESVEINTLVVSQNKLMAVYSKSYQHCAAKLFQSTQFSDVLAIKFSKACLARENSGKQADKKAFSQALDGENKIKNKIKLAFKNSAPSTDDAE